MNEQNVDEIETPGPPEIKEFTDNILTAPILIFDLETTGLQRTSDIIQIAAFSQNNKFSSYIMPNRAISNGASEINLFVNDVVTVLLSLKRLLVPVENFEKQVFEVLKGDHGSVEYPQLLIQCLYASNEVYDRREPSGYSYSYLKL
ncbi:uncharacterized protein LOC143072453 isoform X1 [Mytilus galloprovincialis]|uniref:uncharacterized protein LOC143072453 isoform X1 n=1 Tax=Mytilus galloprovincialis TaxID=29158 RepID=UPI003F7CD119